MYIFQVQAGSLNRPPRNKWSPAIDGRMEYKAQAVSEVKIAPRLIIHGGAGNIARPTLGDGKYAAYREALLTIVRTVLATSTHNMCSTWLTVT